MGLLDYIAERHTNHAVHICTVCDTLVLHASRVRDSRIPRDSIEERSSVRTLPCTDG